MIDNETGEVSKLVYAVGDKTFDKLKDALDASKAVTEGDSTVKVYGKPTAAETETVTGEQTIVDLKGRTYTVPADATAELTVETDGTITVKDGNVEFDPGDAVDKSVKVGDDTPEGTKHVVTPDGPVTFDIKKGDTTTTGTVKPTDPQTAVDIDGVVYKAPAEAEPAPAYDLDKPFDGLPKGGTATVPGGSAKEVVVSGTEPDGGFTVKTDADNSGNTVITKGGDDENVAGQVEVPAGDTVTVNGNEYKAKAGEDGGAKLDLVKDAVNGDHAELVEGEITLPADASEHDNSVYVAGKEVTNPNTDKDITVKADKEKGTGTVTVPGGGKVTIGDDEYTNAGSDDLVIEVGPKGNTLTDGTLTLPGNAAEELPDAAINVKSGDEYVSVTNKGGEGKDITVSGSDEAADSKPSVTVPGGGAVDIGGTEYTVPAGETPTKFVIGEDGKPNITSGAVELDDNESVGFGSVEIGSGNTDPDGDTKKPVKVEVQEDGKAKVTVPAGETLTVTDADGKTHTYKNKGTENLEFTVDKDGNVTVDKLPDNGIDLGGGSTITLTGDGAGDNTLTAGADGATLKPTTDETNPNNPPLLEKGSVIFPDGTDGKKGSVVVKDPTATTNENKTLEGTDVEVFAGNSKENPVKVQAKSEEAKVQVQGGTEYIFPEGEAGGPAPMDNGTLFDPAKGEISDNKDGPKDGNYVLVPDKANNTDGRKLWTDKSADPDSNDTHVLGDKGAAFDVKVKLDGHTGKEDEDLQTGSLGRYEVTEQDSHFTVDSDNGEVTLTDGGLHMKKGEPALDDKVPSVLLDGIAEDESGKGLEVSGEDVTVTMPGTDAEGKPDGGADVTVPGGKKVKIGETEYEAGEKGLTLHVDKDGGVSLKDGAVKLDDGESIPFGDIVFENPTGSGDDQVTVTAPMKDVEGYGDGSAKVVVPKGTGDQKASVVVGKESDGKEYKNSGETDLELEVTPDGEVKLHKGEVELPENGPVTAGDTEVQSTTPGTKVEAKEDGKFDVKVPGSSGESENKVTLTVPGEDGQPNKELEYTNPSDTDDMVIEVPVQENGYPTLTDGSAELDPSADGKTGEGLNVKTGEGSTPVENTGDEPFIVNAKGEGDEGNASVDIPAGGSADIGKNSVEASGDEELHVELDDEGGIKIKPGEGNEVTVNGKAYRTKEGSPEAELVVDKDGKVTSSDGFDVVVEPGAGLVHLDDGESVQIGETGLTVEGGPGWIYVNEDGSIDTVTVDEDGKSVREKIGHFFNPKDGEKASLKVKEGDDGVPVTTLTDGTVRAGAGSEIHVEDDVLKAGDNGAVLGVTKGEDGSAKGPAKLTKGSVILPEGDAFDANNPSVKVENDNGTETTFKGQNVEVFPDGSVVGVDNSDAEGGKSGGTVTVSDSAEAEIEHQYHVPAGEGKAALEKDGDNRYNKLGKPAMERLGEKLGGADSEPYVVVPDSGNESKNLNVYVVDSAVNSQNQTVNTLHPDEGAAFDVVPKEDTDLGDSIGHYEAKSDDVKAAVNHTTGEVTLTEGTLAVTGKGEEPDTGAKVLVPGAGGRTSSVVGDGTNEFTVTVPGTDAEGNEGGADVVVPAGGSVTIDGQKYSATEGELTLHVDEDGTVSVKAGTVKLSDGASVAYGDTVFTNPADSGNDEVVVTVSDDGAELTVPGGKDNSVAVWQGGVDRTYTNGDASSALKLHSDTGGNITLEGGTVTLPEGGTVKTGDDGCTVTGKGVDVTKGDDGAKDTVTAEKGESFTVDIPAKADGTGEGKYTYENAGEDDLVVELVDDNNLPLLKDGTAGLPTGSAIGLTGGGRVKNTGDGEVTASVDDADGTVTIPDGGSAEINGVKVSAAAGEDGEAVEETVKFNAEDGSGVITVEEGQSIVLNGVTYTGTEDGGTITIKKDGSIEFEGGISRTVKAGQNAEGVELKPGQKITIEHADGTTSTVTGVAENSKLDVIYSETAYGDIEMYSGEVAIKGKAETAAAADAAEDTSWYYVGQPEITVRAEDGQPVSGAVVTFTYKDESGNVVTLTATTDENGIATRFKKAGTDEVVDLPYGSYEYAVVTDGKTRATGTIHINATDVKREITVELVNVSAKVEGNATTVPTSEDLLY